MIIFPEGTRTKDPGGAIQEFRQGSLRFALQHDLPILPTVIDGTRYLENLEKHASTPRSARLVRLKIGKVMHSTARSAPERRQFMAELREEIISIWQGIRVEWPQS